jgi:hypothetical protein
MASVALTEAPAIGTAQLMHGVRIEALMLAPQVPALDSIHGILADAELESFGALKPTDSSCYGAQLPCNRTCC